MIQIERLKKPILNTVRQNREAVKWVYSYVAGMLLLKDKEQLKHAAQHIEQQLKLSRPTLLEEYLDYPTFHTSDKEILELREKLLLKLVQKEQVEAWLRQHKPPAGKKEIRLSREHNNRVLACSFSPNGTALVYASGDGKLML